MLRGGRAAHRALCIAGTAVIGSSVISWCLARGGAALEAVEVVALHVGEVAIAFSARMDASGDVCAAQRSSERPRTCDAAEHRWLGATLHDPHPTLTLLVHDTRGPHIAGGRTRGDSSADGLTLSSWRVGRSIETTLLQPAIGAESRAPFQVSCAAAAPNPTNARISAACLQHSLTRLPPNHAHPSPPHHPTCHLPVKNSSVG